MFLPHGRLAVEAIEPDLDIRQARRRSRDIAILHQAVKQGRLKALVLAPSRERRYCGEKSGIRRHLHEHPPGEWRDIDRSLRRPGEQLRGRANASKNYPGCDIRMLPIDAIAAGGGGIRCLTQPVPV